MSPRQEACYRNHLTWVWAQNSTMDLFVESLYMEMRKTELLIVSTVWENNLKKLASLTWKWSVCLITLFYHGKVRKFWKSIFVAIINFHLVTLHRVLRRNVARLLSEVETRMKDEDKVNQEHKELREALEDKSKELSERSEGAAKYNTF